MLLAFSCKILYVYFHVQVDKQIFGELAHVGRTRLEMRPVSCSPASHNTRPQHEAESVRNQLFQAFQQLTGGLDRQRCM